ncbi:MAG: hypothetical protein L6R40_002126 [Gallowayella cf. fulva]|nr:MAG: hypothetical protein L6R40_002126 [Xanthomendoza cf. fulva]
MMSESFVVVSVIGLLLSLLSLLLISKPQQQMVYSRLSSWAPFTSHHRHNPSSKTPPRSLSPGKKPPGNVPPPADYKDIFPPWRREALSIARKDLCLDPVTEVPDFLVREHLIPFTADYRTCKSPSSTYTPMGISLSEVASLGDFTDYAELSGVPLPEPYQDFNLDTALPRPYRPLRWGYHQTMALNRLQPDWWLEVEKTYVERIKERKHLFSTNGNMVLDYLPGSELGCKEVMEMALQFLCARYPQYFSLCESEDHGYVFHNGILHNQTVIRDMHPLHVLLENVPEDFAVMIRNPEDGYYYFRAGILCSSLGWSVKSKLGMQLKEIHSPIPDYKEKMEFSMDRYFAKLPTSRPIQRGSWGLEVDTPLFMPPGDPHEKLRESQLPEAELPLSRIHLRVDWQTLRRLPLSGAIIFNFKALFTPVEEFREEPYIPALLTTILHHGKPSIMAYKNTWHVEHVVLPALQRWMKEQEERGLVPRGWDVGTLQEAPFFPGWEEVWRGRQGF